MPEDRDRDIKDFIRRQAEAETPDAWPEIERRIRHMEQNNKTKAKKAFKRYAVAAAACAVLALAAAAVLAKPGFLWNQVALTSAPGTSVATQSPVATRSPIVTQTPIATPAATADMTVREPVPFTDSTTLTMDKGPSRDIKFYESLQELVKSEWAKDIGVFKFVKETGSVPAADGIALYTTYEMQAVRVFKGTLKPGDTITVRTFGGASDKVWIEDNFIERFTADFGYVLFLDSFDDNGAKVYQLASPLQGYVPIRNGFVSLNKKIGNNGLFAQGESLEDLSKRIEDALK